MLRYFMTYTGTKVYPGDLQSLDITLEDIAHGLASEKRFGQAQPLNYTYSVAEHSLHLASIGEREQQRLALMHDATEAYLGDVVSALKAVLPDYVSLEKELEDLIFKRYNINTAYKSKVKELDTRILLDESKALLPMHYAVIRKAHPGIRPLGVKIMGTSDLEDIKDRFLQTCEKLDIKDY